MARSLVNNMELTGVDYVIYSTPPTSVSDIKNSFHQYLKTRWERFIVDDELFFFENHENDECFELFYAKCEKMDRLHKKKGYNLDSNGEGCFMLMGRKFEKRYLEIFIPEQVHDPSRRNILCEGYNSNAGFAHKLSVFSKGDWFIGDLQCPKFLFLPMPPRSARSAAQILNENGLFDVSVVINYIRNSGTLQSTGYKVASSHQS